MKMPFIKFYPRDWQADPELRMCSLEARGLWIEMLCVMHNAKRRGFLETPTGIPLDDDQTCRLIGTFKDDLYRCKYELVSHGVPSIEHETNIWYCRRMVKETAKSEKCSEAGRLGGGNPKLNKENSEYQIPDTRNHISLKDTFKGEIDCVLLSLSERRRDILKTWLEYKSEKKQSYKPIGLKTLIKNNAHLSDEQLKNAIENSMAQNYSGIFEVKPSFKNTAEQLREEQKLADARRLDRLDY